MPKPKSRSPPKKKSKTPHKKKGKERGKVHSDPGLQPQLGGDIDVPEVPVPLPAAEPKSKSPLKKKGGQSPTDSDPAPGLGGDIPDATVPVAEPKSKSPHKKKSKSPVRKKAGQSPSDPDPAPGLGGDIPESTPVAESKRKSPHKKKSKSPVKKNVGQTLKDPDPTSGLGDDVPEVPVQPAVTEPARKSGDRNKKKRHADPGPGPTVEEGKSKKSKGHDKHKKSEPDSEPLPHHVHKPRKRLTFEEQSITGMGDADAAAAAKRFSAKFPFLQNQGQETRKSAPEEDLALPSEQEDIEHLMQEEQEEEKKSRLQRIWGFLKEYAAKSDVFAKAHTMPKHQACIFVSFVMIPLSLISIAWDILAAELFEIPHLSTLNTPGLILFINFMALPIAMYGYMMEYLMHEGSRQAYYGLFCVIVHPVLFIARASMELYYDGYRGQRKLYFEIFNDEDK